MAGGGLRSFYERIHSLLGHEGRAFRYVFGRECVPPNTGLVEADLLDACESPGTDVDIVLTGPEPPDVPTWPLRLSYRESNREFFRHPLIVARTERTG